MEDAFHRYTDTTKYIRMYPKAEQPLLAWNQEAESALWSSPDDLKGQCHNASILSPIRVVFKYMGIITGLSSILNTD